MNVVPSIATVADLQRSYRTLVEAIKRTGEPLVVVNNGKPDVVVLGVDAYNTKAKRLKELEEDYILRLSQKAIAEHKQRKTIKMRDDETFLDVLHKAHDD